jgi:hypothetical protein
MNPEEQISMGLCKRVAMPTKLYFAGSQEFTTEVKNHNLDHHIRSAEECKG